MEKFVAGVLQVSAGVMLFAAGTIGPPVGILLLVGGTVAGTAALTLWGRHSRPAVPPAAVEPSRPQLPATSRIEEALESLQDEVAQLRDEHRFHQQLYSGQRKPEQQR